MTTIRILTLLAVAGLVCGSAMATVRTFQPDDGIWGDRFNWLPDDDYPKEGDTAIIPIYKRCRVEDDDQAARIIQVYGTLGLVGHDLELNSTLTSTIDHILYFKEADGHVPELHFIAGHWLEGSGTITAKRDDGYGPGVIAGRVAGPYTSLVIESGLTVTGSILVRNLWLIHRGDFIVNHADDEMQLELDIPFRPASKLSGDGAIQVSAGKLHVGALAIYASATVSFRLSGGEMKFVGEPSIDAQVPFTVTGGVLDIQKDLRTSGASVFRNATIKVKQGKAAEFY